MALDTGDAEELKELLARDERLNHLCVKRRGDSLTMVSSLSSDIEKHARLTHLGRDQWGLSLPRHTGRWERTPFTGTMEALVGTLQTDFSWYLYEQGTSNS